VGLESASPYQREEVTLDKVEDGLSCSGGSKPWQN